MMASTPPCDFDPIAYINEPRWQQSRLGLERITELLHRLGDPQDRLRFVHVAGTNGKGSTCAYLESILRASGLRTGLFTSPYLIDFKERIRVDGMNITDDELAKITWAVRVHAEAMAEESGEHPTEFELMCAVAFECFSRAGCDIVVCEVGLGGRFDATNVIAQPDACVITRIGLDHTDLLGNTLGAIAAEKAAIIKPGALVVSWPQDDPAAMGAIEDAALACGDELIVADLEALSIEPLEDFERRRFIYGGSPYETSLLGAYQPANASLAIECAWGLARKGWSIAQSAISQGIAQAQWPGRFELVESAPVPIVVDGGHNPQGVRALASSLKDIFGERPVIFVMGILADKGYRAMIDEVIPLAERFICVSVPNPRTLSADDLAHVVRESSPEKLPVEAAVDWDQAMKRARMEAGPRSVICAFGSLYSIAAIRAAIEASRL